MSVSGNTNYFREVDGHRRKSFNGTRLVIWARNCSFLDCLLVCCINWICKTHRKVTVELFKRQDGPLGFLLHRRNCQTFYRIQKKATDGLCHYKTEQNRSSASCFMEKSEKKYGPIGWRWVPQHYRRTLGDYPGSEMSLSIPQFWKLLRICFLFT